MSTLTELKIKHDELIKKLEQISKDKQAEKEEAEKREAAKKEEDEKRKTAKLLEIQCEILEALVKHGKCIVCETDVRDLVSNIVSSDLQIVTIPEPYPLKAIIGFIVENKAYSGFTISAEKRAIGTKGDFTMLSLV